MNALVGRHSVIPTTILKILLVCNIIGDEMMMMLMLMMMLLVATV